MEISRLVLLAALTALFSLPALGQGPDPLRPIFGDQSLGQWVNGIYTTAAQAPGPGSDGPQTMLLLAASRTKRPDILHGFKLYRGGWDIKDRHYWASVGFTGAAGFIVASLWLVAFGFVISVHFFRGWAISFNDAWSSRLQISCLILLIIFTCIAVIGCVFLSIGQVRFRGEALNTLSYVVNQSDYTVQTLKNVTEYLYLAKTVNVAQVFLPSNVKYDIDKLTVDLNTAADMLREKTNENSDKIRRVFTTMRSSLIAVATVMLVISLLGLFLSAFEHRHAIHIFILGGWLLVAITCVLCGVFLILDNVISDTCVAMEEWVENPHAETALSSILPCVDPRTTNHTLIQSRLVVTNIINVVNQVIYTVANTDPLPNDPKYYNQSGPQIPALCYPFDDRQCGALDVSISNASEVWRNYTCVTSALGVCMDAGRVTVSMYQQLVAAVNVSYALKHYVPPLLSLRDCNFVRETFHRIKIGYCPQLERDLRMVVVGLGLVSVGVSLCLLLWVLYSNRPPREEVFVNGSGSSSSVGKESVNGGDDKTVPSSTKASPACMVAEA